MATVPDDNPCDLDPFIPEPLPPSEPTLPFPDWIRLAASAIRFHGNGSRASLWLASKVDEIAAEAEALKARTPAEFEARHDVMVYHSEYEIWSKAEAAGFDAAVQAHGLQSCYQ